MTGSILDTARKDLQAMEAYTQALKMSCMLSSKHPGKTLAKGCLGCLLYYNGELELAKKCYEKALEERKKKYGPEHVDTAVMMNNFACCLSFLGQVEEATLYFRNAFRIFKTQYGLSHPRTSLIARNHQELQPFHTRYKVFFSFFH
jgi:tetratricopeptide (TPR) repeat protein